MPKERKRIEYRSKEQPQLDVGNYIDRSVTAILDSIEELQTKLTTEKQIAKLEQLQAIKYIIQGNIGSYYHICPTYEGGVLSHCLVTELGDYHHLVHPIMQTKIIHRDKIVANIQI